jgi:hypothetical protein
MIISPTFLERESAGKNTWSGPLRGARPMSIMHDFKRAVPDASLWVTQQETDDQVKSNLDLAHT